MTSISALIQNQTLNEPQKSYNMNEKKFITAFKLIYLYELVIKLNGHQIKISIILDSILNFISNYASIFFTKYLYKKNPNSSTITIWEFTLGNVSGLHNQTLDFIILWSSFSFTCIEVECNDGNNTMQVKQTRNHK